MAKTAEREPAQSSPVKHQAPRRPCQTARQRAVASAQETALARRIPVAPQTPSERWGAQLSGLTEAGRPHSPLEGRVSPPPRALPACNAERCGRHAARPPAPRPSASTRHRGSGSDLPRPPHEAGTRAGRPFLGAAMATVPSPSPPLSGRSPKSRGGPESQRRAARTAPDPKRGPAALPCPAGPRSPPRRRPAAHRGHSPPSRRAAD